MGGTLGTIGCASKESSMRTLLWAATATFVLASSAQAQYCASSGTNTNQWISSITLNGATRASGKDTGGYVHPTTLFTTLTAGQSYTLGVQVSTGTPSTGCPMHLLVSAWLDVTTDGTFSNSDLPLGDRIPVGDLASVTCGQSATASKTFTVPSGAFNGTTRLRVVVKFINSGGTANPCETGFGGETEDLDVTITGGAAKCGNKLVDSGEGCDDGNTTAGDGCSATCALEKGWTCPTVGSPCICATGFTGTGCAACAAGYWGADCLACPGGAVTPCTGHGTCSSGKTGTGLCACTTGFGGTACGQCAAGYYGSTCLACPGGAATPCTNHGT